MPQQPQRAELLWEQAVDDGASTGDFTLAHQIELQQKLAEAELTITERNDAAILEIVALSAQLPKTVDQYIALRQGLLDIGANTHLTDATRAVAENCRHELETEFPDLHAASLAELQSRTAELAAISGLGNGAVKLSQENK